MKTQYYALKDTKLSRFMSVYPCQDDKEAVVGLKRALEFGLIKNIEPEALDLYKVGEFDDKSGEFFPCLEYLANAVDCSDKKVNDDEKQ